MNRRYRFTNALLATSTLVLTMATCPAMISQAQQSPVAVGTARLSATRGVVEVQSADGHWDKVEGSVVLVPGRAVRTSDDAEAVATFDDGSTVRLSDNSALKITELASAADGAHLTAKVLGDVTSTFSPNRVASGTVDLEFPMGRAVINKQLAVGRAVRPDLASSEAQIRIVTVTASDVRIGVASGVVTMQNSYNLRGNVVAIDEPSHSFTLLDDSTQQNRRIMVNPETQLATPNHDQVAPLTTSVHDVLAAVQGQNGVVVYGVPAAAEGPGDSSALNATTIYPRGGDTFNGVGFLNAPSLPPLDDGSTLQGGDAAAFAPSGIGVIHFGFGHQRHSHEHPRDWPRW